MNPLTNLLRPYQWVKNGFVLIGVFFAHAWKDPELLFGAIFAAIAFCLISSSVYIINDLIDVEKDRLHPTKRKRPIASGTISVNSAILISVCLALVSFGIGIAVSWMVFLILLTYFFLNLVYSLHLKKTVILDVFCIAFGFMLRILAGTVGIGIRPSKWLLLCGFMLTLFLGFAKRRAEVITVSLNQQNYREVLQNYGAIFLDSIIAICVSSVILTYSMYTMSPETVKVHGTDHLIFTVPFVVYALFRYLYLVDHQRGGEDAAKELVRDPHLLLAISAWFLLTLWIFVNKNIRFDMTLFF